MLRSTTVRWAIFAAFLIVVGLWPAAVAPLEWASSGAATVLSAIPVQVLLAAVVIAWLWLKRNPAPARPARA
ncbi:hypothetical protein KJK32_45470 (plasmid) [Streptomyces sp. JCM17656]|nr:hypothetical protein KJK32_45470 [Streptomyces sp. JCM17656]